MVVAVDPDRVLVGRGDIRSLMGTARVLEKVHMVLGIGLSASSGSLVETDVGTLRRVILARLPVSKSSLRWTFERS